MVTTYHPILAKYMGGSKSGNHFTIDQVPLPNLAEQDLLVRKNGKEALIAHGGFCSLFPNQSPVIYDVITPQITSVLPDDNSEARVTAL